MRWCGGGIGKLGTWPCALHHLSDPALVLASEGVEGGDLITHCPRLRISCTTRPTGHGHPKPGQGQVKEEPQEGVLPFYIALAGQIRSVCAHILELMISSPALTSPIHPRLHSTRGQDHTTTPKDEARQLCQPRARRHLRLPGTCAQSCRLGGTEWDGMVCHTGPSTALKRNAGAHSTRAKYTCTWPHPP